jgi:hypothetical protein
VSYRHRVSRDHNHSEVTGVLDQLFVPYIDLSPLGDGIPDLVVDNHGQLELWEVKNPANWYGKKGLNANQSKWAKTWRGKPVRVIRTVDDALIALGVKIGA